MRFIYEMSSKLFILYQIIGYTIYVERFMHIGFKTNIWKPRAQV